MKEPHREEQGAGFLNLESCCREASGLASRISAKSCYQEATEFVGSFIGSEGDERLRISRAPTNRPKMDLP